jgi:hypothetical protein
MRLLPGSSANGCHGSHDIRQSGTTGGESNGHDYRTAPPPGVKVLWLGWRELTAMVRGWRLARGQEAGGIYDA